MGKPAAGWQRSTRPRWARLGARPHPAVHEVGDYAWYLDEVPGAMARLGTAIVGRDVDLHSSTFDIDENPIEAGILAGSAALLELLEAAG